MGKLLALATAAMTVCSAARAAEESAAAHSLYDAGIAAAAARSASAPSVTFAAGVFALVKELDYPYSVGATWNAGPATRWLICPGFGAAFGPEGMAYFHFEARRDFAFASGRWFVTPSLAAGYFINGDYVGPREQLEFQTGLGIARQYRTGLRVGLELRHISNGGRARPNSGTEALLVTLRMPLAPPRPVAEARPDPELGPPSGNPVAGAP